LAARSRLSGAEPRQQPPEQWLLGDRSRPRSTIHLPPVPSPELPESWSCAIKVSHSRSAVKSTTAQRREGDPSNDVFTTRELASPRANRTPRRGVTSSNSGEGP